MTTKDSYEVYKGDDYSEYKDDADNHYYFDERDAVTDNKNHPLIRVVFEKVVGVRVFHEPNPYKHIARYSLIFGLFFCAFTATVGLISWILMPNSRKFKNYVFCMIVCNFTVLYLLLKMTETLENNDGLLKAIYFFSNSCTWWLVLASGMMYMNAANLPKREIARKISTSNLFVWTLASIATVLKVADDVLWGAMKWVQIFDVQLIVPMTVNCIMYVVVMRIIGKEFEKMTQTRRHKMQAVTLAFLTGCIIMVALGMVTANNGALGSAALIVSVAQTAVVNLFFLKQNRLAWNDFTNLKRQFIQV